MVLSLRPSMRNSVRFPSSDSRNSAISFVSKRCAQTAGASITRQPLLFSDTFTLSNGVYQSLLSFPFKRRRAMCESVSVIPYVLHTAFGKFFSCAERLSSILPPPIIRWRMRFNRSHSLLFCSVLNTCKGTIAANVMGVSGFDS